jgi:hypothetical protein
LKKEAVIFRELAFLFGSIKMELDFFLIWKLSLGVCFSKLGLVIKLSL